MQNYQDTPLIGGAACPTPAGYKAFQVPCTRVRCVEARRDWSGLSIMPFSKVLSSTAREPKSISNASTYL
ncbi:hypothetical protein KQX54_020265 [Cotesia glomerata]|uniref:Uncharacterized protein n=1 Tax=Cotesia glomerata TaxID=32391 RepID=A0AAV7IHJ0_COTGL|nr:hypothetical protein KQX54_020265 [Cotesia glomerata]